MAEEVLSRVLKQGVAAQGNSAALGLADPEIFHHFPKFPKLQSATHTDL